MSLFSCTNITCWLWNTFLVFCLFVCSHQEYLPLQHKDVRHIFFKMSICLAAQFLLLSLCYGLFVPLAISTTPPPSKSLSLCVFHNYLNTDFWRKFTRTVQCSISTNNYFLLPQLLLLYCELTNKGHYGVALLNTIYRGTTLPWQRIYLFRSTWEETLKL